MRVVSMMAMAVVLGVSSGGAAVAQTALEGPLAAPGTAAPTPTVKPAKPKHRKPAKTARRSDPKSDGADYASGALPVPAHPLGRALDTPASPVDFGMKWNGSADSARETRVQNYDGTAAGTGAEVGMKLHF